jgi:phage shock protein PspC (stress-responsive transcriptional regulator)
MEKKLQRNEQDKVVAGVCAGLADYLEIDVTWVRVAFVASVFTGFGFFAYIILWIAVPARPFMPYNPGYNPYSTDYRVYEKGNFSSEPKPEFSSSQEPFKPYTKNQPEGNGKIIFGLIFIALGGFFLLNEFHMIPDWFDLGKLWPLVFIIPGIIMISKAGKNNKAKYASEKEPIFEQTTAQSSNTDQPSN